MFFSLPWLQTNLLKGKDLLSRRVCFAWQLVPSNTLKLLYSLAAGCVKAALSDIFLHSTSNLQIVNA